MPLLKIIPLGGLGEIGMNMMVFEYGDTMFVADSGLMFPEDYMLGVDFVIPNLDYVRQNRTKVAAIVLTHAHEDHIGALPYLLREINVPVFGTPFTLGLVRHKLEELELISGIALHEIYPEEIYDWVLSNSNLSGSGTVWSMVSGLRSTPPAGFSFIPVIIKSAMVLPAA